MPSSKKRKVASDLPYPLELLANSKAAKRSSIQRSARCYISLDLLQFENELLEKLSDDEKLAWLIAKFGWNAVSSVGECIRSFPTSLTESPRSGLFAKFYQDISTYQHISSFVVDHCSTFFRCQPTLRLKFLHPQRGYAFNVDRH